MWTLDNDISHWERLGHVKNSLFRSRQSRDGILNSRRVLTPQKVDIIVHIPWDELICVRHYIWYNTKLFHNFNSVDYMLKMWKSVIPTKFFLEFKTSQPSSSQFILFLSISLDATKYHYFFSLLNTKSPIVLDLVRAFFMLFPFAKEAILCEVYVIYVRLSDDKKALDCTLRKFFTGSDLKLVRKSGQFRAYLS